MTKPAIKCAIYTRKSSDEGLEQSFNSLDAQREACEAYIKSQKHEGWQASTVLYNDGGYSGGSMERPGLQLMGDIQSGKVNIIVVYKVDMLSACADRYGVSLIAAILRWLQYTERRAVLVVSRDGFILWARSSANALKSGAFFKTSGAPPIPIHPNALANKQTIPADDQAGVHHPPGVWFQEDCTEIGIISEQYDFVISLINLENRSGAYFRDEKDEDVLDFMTRKQN